MELEQEKRRERERERERERRERQREEEREREIKRNNWLSNQKARQPLFKEEESGNQQEVLNYLQLSSFDVVVFHKKKNGTCVCMVLEQL